MKSTFESIVKQYLFILATNGRVYMHHFCSVTIAQDAPRSSVTPAPEMLTSNTLFEKASLVEYCGPNIWGDKASL